ncbi:MAG: hypothetical protein LBL98_02330 [Ruminococcus sp.]|jgi:hypothetical protein|nr:hypothetical protein [Ruminococcus sp.]
MKEIGSFESSEIFNSAIAWKKAFTEKYEEEIAAPEWILIQACTDVDGHIEDSVIKAVREAVREIFSQGYSRGTIDGYVKCFNTHNTDRRHIVHVRRRSA